MCTEENHVNKLKCDTRSFRLKHFKQCLSHLNQQLLSVSYNHITHVVIPCGIGRSGRIDETWLTEYLPLIGELTANLHHTGINFVLVCNGSYMSILEHKYNKDSTHHETFTFNFQKLKCLPKLPVNTTTSQHNVKKIILVKYIFLIVFIFTVKQMILIVFLYSLLYPIFCKYNF